MKLWIWVTTRVVVEMQQITAQLSKYIYGCHYINVLILFPIDLMIFYGVGCVPKNPSARSECILFQGIFMLCSTNSKFHYKKFNYETCDKLLYCLNYRRGGISAMVITLKTPKEDI